MVQVLSDIILILILVKEILLCNLSLISFSANVSS